MTHHEIRVSFKDGNEIVTVTFDCYDHFTAMILDSVDDLAELN
jgi:hypothetical protein